jgi:hypothetical protein
MKNAQSSETCSECAHAIKHCNYFCKVLNCGTIDVNEFTYNVAVSLLTMCDRCRRIYLASLPDSTAAPFAARLQFILDSEGVKAFIRAFVVNFLSEEEFRIKTQEYAPKVLQLSQAVKERVADLAEDSQPHGEQSS